MKTFNDIVVDNIVVYLKEKSYKKNILSKATGLKAYTITAILKKRRKLDMSEYLRITRYLELPYDYFFRDKKEDSAIPPRTSESPKTEI